MKKVLFVASTLGHIKSFHLPYLRFFKERGFQVDVAANGSAELPPEYNVHVVPFERSPFHKNNILAYKQLKKIITENDYDIIHCHTPVASILTRIVARKVRKKGTKVIYTAHGFHFYKGAPLKNWLLYYPVEKLCARFTDVLITINREDYARARKKLKAKKVVYVPGVGVDLNKFGTPTVEKAQKRKELGIPENAKILLSVGEVNLNKNHQVVIKALSFVPDDSIHYVIAGTGNQIEPLKQLAESLGLGKRVHFLGFRKDIPELCLASDIFCFPSKREGLSVALMEAMAYGLPCIVSNIRGNVDLIDNEGGELFEPERADLCRDAVQSILNRDFDSMGTRNKSFIKTFDLEAVMTHMCHIYNI